MLLALFTFGHGSVFDDQLSSLSPVPEKRLLTDRLLRSAAASPDMRYQLVLRAETLETLLLQNEQVDERLNEATHAGLLSGWQSISQLLPSQHIQEQRQAEIPEPDDLLNILREVTQDTVFKLTAFDPFLANARSAKRSDLLTPDAFDNTVLSSWLESHLMFTEGQWVSLISLSHPDPEKLAAELESWKISVELIDLQKSSKNLVAEYRNGAINTILVASLLIIMLLMIDQRQPRKIAWLGLTVASALLVTVAIVSNLHGGLTIIHLVALLLVIGLGLDYALFLSRKESATEHKATEHAVVACAATTTVTFGILALSSIPVLKFLGVTIAIGSFSSFFIAWIGSGRGFSRDAN